MLDVKVKRKSLQDDIDEPMCEESDDDLDYGSGEEDR